MPPDQEREIGRLAGIVEGLRATFDRYHGENKSSLTEIKQLIHDHDTRDQTAFADLVRRLSPLEIRAAAQNTVEAEDDRQQRVRHARLAVAAPIVAAAIGALATWLLMGGHL